MVGQHIYFSLHQEAREAFERFENCSHLHTGKFCHGSHGANRLPFSCPGHFFQDSIVWNGPMFHGKACLAVKRGMSSTCVLLLFEYLFFYCGWQTTGLRWFREFVNWPSAWRYGKFKTRLPAHSLEAGMGHDHAWSHTPTHAYHLWNTMTCHIQYVLIIDIYWLYIYIYIIMFIYMYNHVNNFVYIYMYMYM